jgi:hypothetical protein
LAAGNGRRQSTVTATQRLPVISGAEDAADDLRAGAVVVHGGHEVRQPVAEVVHLPVEALDVVASLLQQLRR